jgi:hypothetical protein
VQWQNGLSSHAAPAGLLGDLRGHGCYHARHLHLPSEGVDHLTQPAGQVLQRGQQDLACRGRQVCELVQVLQRGAVQGGAVQRGAVQRGAVQWEGAGEVSCW